MTSLTELGLPIWHVEADGRLTPINESSEAWEGSPSLPALAHLSAVIRRAHGPGSNGSGSFEAEGAVYQLLSFDGPLGPYILLRPVADGEAEGEVERRLADMVHDLGLPLAAMQVRLDKVRALCPTAEVTLGLTQIAEDLERAIKMVRRASDLGRLTSRGITPTPLFPR